jgi:hypothetical protein
MTGRSWQPLLGFLSLLALLAGCSGDKFALNDSVEGTVKIDNKPLVGVVVQFVPEGEKSLPGSNGVTDERGHYSLTCENQKSGAVVGKHRVVILQGRADSDPRSDDPQGSRGDPAAPVKSNPSVPKMYSLAAKTPLVIEVKPDQHTYDLTLTSGRTR